MEVRRLEFQKQLKRFKRIAVDSAPLIYHLEDTLPYSELTEDLFHHIALGATEVLVSTISAGELLVKPFMDADNDAVATFETFVLSIPSAQLIAPSYTIAKEAARLRARHRLRMPDALVLATASDMQCEALITNDLQFRRIPKLQVEIVALEDYL